MSIDTGTAVTPIAADEVVLLDPELTASPTITHDADQGHVGAAHGRVIPLVGLYRPYIYDLAADKITDDNLRIYADTADDAIAVLVGGPLPQVLADLTAATEALPTNPAEGDLLDETSLLLLGEDADEVAAPLTEDEFQAHGRYLQALDRHDDLRIQVAGLIAGHADMVRCTAQAEINAAARQDGRWDRLTDDERQHLEMAADAGPDGRFPTGLPQMVPFFNDDGEESGTVMRGVWDAEVPLVCNRGNYFPWNEVLPPESMVAAEDDEGETYIVPGEPNLVWLDIDSPQVYLDSLVAAGVVNLTTRPVDHPLEFMRPFLREKRERDRATLLELAEQENSKR